jgi:transposase-like protein
MSKRRDPEARRRILDQWKRSDLSSHAFARRVGVSYSTLYKWRRELGARATFVEVVPRGAAVPARPSRAGIDPAVEIALPTGVVVRVGRDVDEALLRLVVRALD